VFSGGLSSTGAARLAAMACARVGAGAVTVWSPESALAANAAHLTSIMLRRIDNAGDLREALSARAPESFVLGPGYGLRRPLREMALALMAQAEKGLLVLDADGITAFRDAPADLFDAVRRSKLDLVLTPHAG